MLSKENTLLFFSVFRYVFCIVFHFKNELCFSFAFYGYNYAMKKKVFFPIFLSVLSSFSCANFHKKNISITFGRLYDSSLSKDVNSFFLHTSNITYEEYAKKVSNKENFVLAVYEYKALMEGEDIDCLCYTSFASSLREYMEKYNAEIYAIDSSELSSFSERYGLHLLLGEQTLAIFENGEIKKQETSGEERLSSLEKVENFFENVTWSKMLYINKEQLDTFLETNGQYTIGYLRKSCSDCSYLSYHFLKKYNQESFAKEIYVVECDEEGIRYKDGKFDSEAWSSFKDKYGLSNKWNLSFGYDAGYVPSFFTYQVKGKENVSIIDGAVYANDTLLMEDSLCHIQTSYWDQREHPFYSSIDKEIKTNLVGLEIASEDYLQANDDYYWKKEKMAKHHDPLLKAFLDFYAKKGV